MWDEDDGDKAARQEKEEKDERTRAELYAINKLKSEQNEIKFRLFMIELEADKLERGSER